MNIKNRRRDERRKLAGSGCEKRPGGRRSATGEEVGFGCDREVLQRIMATDVGGGRTEEWIKKYPETVETGGSGGV